MKVVVIGAGNLGLVCAARMAAKSLGVALLTRTPDKWPEIAAADDCFGSHFEGKCEITDDPRCVSFADLVFLCLPGNAFRTKLMQIKPYLRAGTPVASIFSGDGFFFIAEEMLGEDWPVLGFQRVPFICRTKVPFRLGGITGYKKELFLACRNVQDQEKWRMFFADICDTKTSLLDNFYDAALINAGVVMHPARLMSLGKIIDEVGPFNRMPLFYEEWDDVASEWAIRLDEEVRSVGSALGAHITPFLEYYESSDVQSLSRKIRSIPAFKGIGSPISTNGYFDYSSRYFQADVNISLASVVELATKHLLSCHACMEVLHKLGGVNGRES